MGKCNIEFEIVHKFTINMDVYENESIEGVEGDIQTIVADFDAQIEDMISGERKPKLITQQGHVVRLISPRQVRVTKDGERAIISEAYK